MKSSRWVVGFAVFAVLGGAAVAFSIVQQQRATETEVVKLVTAGEAVLAAEQLDAGAAQTALRELREHELAAADARLILMQARLLLALGRLQPAWDTLMPLALALEPGAAELLVAARILQRLHGIRGDSALIGQAADFAEGHHDMTGEVGSLFLAWQCSRRAGRTEAAEALGAKLQADFGETPEGKLVAALANESTALDDLLALEIELSGRRGPLDGPLPPEEIDYAIAFLMLKSGNPDQIHEAISRAERVLRTVASDPDTRHLLAYALHLSGDQKKRDLHLDWLLENAPADDARRDTWAKMKQQPAGVR